MHGVQTHGFRNLRSIILAVRLPARIGRAGIGHQRQYLGKAILVKIILGEFPLKSFRHHPIAVVQRQPLAYVDDSLGVVMAEAKGFQNLVHKGAVFGDNPPLQLFAVAAPGAHF